MSIDVLFGIPGKDMVDTLWPIMQATSVSVSAARKIQTVYNWDGSAHVLHGKVMGRVEVTTRMAPGSLLDIVTDLREGRLANCPFKIRIGGILYVTTCMYPGTAPLNVQQPPNGLLENKFIFEIIADLPRCISEDNDWLAGGCIMQTLPDLSEITASFATDAGEAPIGTVNAGAISWSQMPKSKFKIGGKLYPGCRVPLGGAPLIENYLGDAGATIFIPVQMGDTGAVMSSQYTVNTTAQFNFTVADGGFEVTVVREYEVIPRLLTGRAGG